MHTSWLFLRLFQLLDSVRARVSAWSFEQLLALLRTNVNPDDTLEFAPYFRLLEPGALDAFLDLRAEMCARPEIYDGMVRLCESFSVQSQVYDIMRSVEPDPDAKFQMYLECLDLGSTTSRHCDIIRNVWDWFERELDPRAVQRLRIVFAEAEVAQEFGMDEEILLKARNLIANDAVYIDILSSLTQHHTCNMPWSETVRDICSRVESFSEGLWPVLERLFDEWRGIPLAVFLEDEAELFRSTLSVNAANSSECDANTGRASVELQGSSALRSPLDPNGRIGDDPDLDLGASNDAGLYCGLDPALDPDGNDKSEGAPGFLAHDAVPSDETCAAARCTALREHPDLEARR
ncbi:hypothetical protein HK105_207074 [Polyrhizophydium stewartii]|uniref:Uncharacterized protein n=1 Tax=Polyrhizophydium stewartii TaxID=2732419 RepID=A0ABR4N1R0_9FUNG|nr:hypothetical protein HK105_000840 [Polyrhizophydium stewartii]